MRMVISPRFGGGSGLKLQISRRWRSRHKTRGISPRFGGGSGLKRGINNVNIDLDWPAYLPSLRRGERIETDRVDPNIWYPARISPRFGGGSGLKLSM